MSYRIGSFNMFKFSFQSDNQIRKSMPQICQIINDNFDIVAIQEIFAPQVLEYQLLRNLGSHWTGCWAQPKAVSPQAAEGYAFIWNQSKFSLAEKMDSHGNIAKIHPKIISSYHTLPGYSKLLRDPYYGRFIPKHGPFFELRLINTHVRFSNNNSDSEDSFENESMITLRKNEIETLIKQICNRYDNTSYGNNRPAYTILLGDYNLNLKNGTNPYPYVSEYYEIIDGPKAKYYRTVQNEKTTLKQNSSLEEDNTAAKYANNYDHFSYNETRLVDELGIRLVASRIDTLNNYYQGNVAKHRLEISDHVPILLEMNL